MSDSWDQVFLDYGARSSDQFLLHYGFLPFPNPAEALFLSLPDGPRSVSFPIFHLVRALLFYVPFTPQDLTRPGAKPAGTK